MRNYVDRARRFPGDAFCFARYTLLRFLTSGGLASAAALSYTTLVSLVPLTAIVLATFSAFPIFSSARDRFLSILMKNFVPDIGDEAAWWFSYFAGNAAQTTALGVLGLALAGILLLAAIEDQMHVIWRVTTPRPWVQRVLAYWTVLTLGPLLIAGSLSLSGYFDRVAHSAGIDPSLFDVTRQAWFGSIARVVPFALETVAFTLVYCLIPNTRVRWREGFIGAVVAAGLVEVLKIGFGLYIARFSSYRTVYGALAGIPIFLFWMYLAWAAILFGAVVAAALPQWRVDEGVPEATEGGRHLGLTLALLAELAAKARRGGTSDTPTLAMRLGVAAAAVEEHMGPLQQAGFIAATADGGWVLARSLETATLFDLYRALELPLAGEWRTGVEAPWQLRIATAMQRIIAAEETAMRVPIARLIVETERLQPTPLPRPSAQRRG